MTVNITKARLKELLAAKGKLDKLQEGLFVDPDGGPVGPGRRNRAGALSGASPELLHQVMREASLERERVARGSTRRVTTDTWESVGPARSPFILDSPATPQVDLKKYNSGRVRQIIQDPLHPMSFYVSTGQGGIWKTNNAGKSWAPVSDSLPSQSIGAIAIDPKKPDNMYVGLGDPFSAAMPGLLRSTNGGKTWSKEPIFLRGSVGGRATTATQTRDLKVSPTNSNVVLAATNVGLFRSEDAGKTFQQVLPPLAADPTHSSARARGAWSLANLGPGQWLMTCRTAAVNNVSGGAIFRSDDDGKTWTEVDLGETAAKVGRMTLQVAPSTVGTSAPRVYVQAADTQGAAQFDVLRSDDGGRTFRGLGVNASGRPINPNPVRSNLELMGGQGFYNQMLTVDPENPDHLIVGGNLAAARSNDGGRTWAIISDWRRLAAGEVRDVPGNPDIYVHADHHAGFIGRVDGKKVVLLGTDGGIFATDQKIFTSTPAVRPDGTSELWSNDWQWSDAWNGSDTRSGINSFLFSSVATSNLPNSPIIGGLQDNGTLVGGVAPAPGVAPGTFEQVLGGDGWETAVSPTNPVIMLASMNGFHVRSADRGLTWEIVVRREDAGLPISGSPFDVQYATMPVTRDFNRDGKSFLTVVDDDVDQNTAQPKDYKTGAYLTTDGGVTWRKAGGQVTRSDGSVIDHIPGFGKEIQVSTVDPKIFGVISTVVDDQWRPSERLFLTKDGGQTWTESEPILPPGNQNGAVSLAFDPRDPTGKTVYVATGGAYGYSEPPGASPAYVYKSSDGGRTFVPIHGGGGPDGLPNVPASVVKVDPDNPASVYVGNVLGVYQSLDGGATWKRLGKGMPFVSVTDVAIRSDKNRERVDLVAGTYGRGVYEIISERRSR